MTFCYFSTNSGCAEKVIERLIRNSCNAIILSAYHPRSAISIIVQVIHNAGEVSFHSSDLLSIRKRDIQYAGLVYISTVLWPKNS